MRYFILCALLILGCREADSKHFNTLTPTPTVEEDLIFIGEIGDPVYEAGMPMEEIKRLEEKSKAGLLLLGVCDKKGGYCGAAGDYMPMRVDRQGSLICAEAWPKEFRECMEQKTGVRLISTLPFSFSCVGRGCEWNNLGWRRE